MSYEVKGEEKWIRVWNMKSFKNLTKASFRSESEGYMLSLPIPCFKLAKILGVSVYGYEIEGEDKRFRVRG
jgi:hypothetical protein